jgi:hypothetical protein
VADQRLPETLIGPTTLGRHGVPDGQEAAGPDLGGQRLLGPEEMAAGRPEDAVEEAGDHGLAFGRARGQVLFPVSVVVHVTPATPLPGSDHQIHLPACDDALLMRTIRVTTSEVVDPACSVVAH